MEEPISQTPYDPSSDEKKRKFSEAVTGALGASKKIAGAIIKIVSEVIGMVFK